MFTDDRHALSFPSSEWPPMHAHTDSTSGTQFLRNGREKKGGRHETEKGQGVIHTEVYENVSLWMCMKCTSKIITFKDFAVSLKSGRGSSANEE